MYIIKFIKKLILFASIIIVVNIITHFTYHETKTPVLLQRTTSERERDLTEPLIDVYEEAENGLQTDVTSFIERSRKKKPLFILLLSSSGRSGSTLLTELLGTRRNSVVFFEPLFRTVKILRDPCHVTGICVARHLKSLAECDYSKDFEDWIKNKQIFYRFFHQDVYYCLRHEKDRHVCKNIDIRHRCRNSTVRIVKVIRTRVASIESLLKDNDLNVKLIYLTRDPRAVLASVSRLKWKNSPNKQCTHMYEDLKDTERLASLYPNRVHRMKLETLSVDPVRTVQKLFGFLYGTAEIYDEASVFVNQHMLWPKKTVSSGLDTVANSSREYEAWRWEITEKLLQEVEITPVCEIVLEKLGHERFGSLTRARDKNVALIKG